MNQKHDFRRIVVLILLACTVMAFLDAVVSPVYFVKSGIKLVLFLGMPILILRNSKKEELYSIVKIRWKKLILPIAMGIIVYLFILGAYYIIGPFFDFSKVTVTLSQTYGVKKENFIFVALYISFINSLLEEFFFRGVGFLILKKVGSRWFAYLFSASVFSLYHVAIMSTWFHPVLFLLLIASLLIAGLFFNWLNEKKGTIYTSCLVHMCANFAINTIGFMLFGII